MGWGCPPRLAHGWDPGPHLSVQMLEGECLVSCCAPMGNGIGPEAFLLVSPIHVPLRHTSAVLAPGCKFSAPSRKGSRHPGTRSFWGSSCQMAPTVCHRPRVFSHLRGPRSSHSLWSLFRTPLVEKAPNREPLTPLCFCDSENTAPCPSEPHRSWDGIEDANYPSPLGLL